MGGKEKSKEHKDSSVAQVADLMAAQLCKEVGYDAPDLIARPLRILGEAMNQQIGGILEWQRDALLLNQDGQEISPHKFLTGIMKASDFSHMTAEFTSLNMDPMARPTDINSLISRVIEGLSGYEDGYLNPFPNFDVVNMKAIAERVGYDEPVAVIESQAEILKRFTVMIERDPDLPRSSCGPPRVIVTNNYKNYGHHFAMQIEIPDSNGGYKSIFDLLIGRRPEDMVDARAAVQEINAQPISYIHDPLMDVAIECADIAGKMDFYPYGAVFRRFDGPLTIARNDTRSDIRLDKHAETLALRQVGDEKRGILYTTTAPCHGCTQSWMGSNVVQINYALMQGVDFDAMNMPLVRKGNKSGQEVRFVWNFNRARKALDMLINNGGEVDFREMIALNELWLERRREEEERLSREAGRPVILSDNWMLSSRHLY